MAKKVLHLKEKMKKETDKKLKQAVGKKKDEEKREKKEMKKFHEPKKGM